MSRLTFLLIVIITSLSGLITASEVKSQHLGAIKLKQAPSGGQLRDILHELEEQTGFTFVYTENIGDIQTAGFDADAATLHDALHEIAERYHLLFHREKQMVALTKAPAPQQPGQLSGVVTDQRGQPLAGVSVRVMPSGRVASTDRDGYYRFSLLPGVYSIEVSYISHGRQHEADLTVESGATTTVDFRMFEQVDQLEEVVIIGYGELQKGDLTGAVSAISESSFPPTRVSSPDQLLKGRISGVHISQNSGQPGATSTLRIRGGTSINAGNDPLIIIDGIPMDLAADASSTNVLQGGSINPLASLRSGDIQSISVLKDASATAIYGSRGANGVIIITTKTGKEGPSKIEFNTMIGSQQLRRKLSLLNAQEYAMIRNEASVNYGADPVYTESEIAGFGNGTDWQDEVFRTALVQNYGLSISGGSGKTQYYISGGYTDHEGIIIHSDLRNLNTRINLNTAFTDKFRVGTSVTLNRIGSNIIRSSTATSGSDAGIVNGALMMDPTLRIYLPDGTYVLRSDNDTPNPVASAREVTNGVTTIRGIGNLFAEYDILDQLTFKTSIGFNYLSNKERFFKPNTIFIAGNQINAAAVGQFTKEYWISSNTLSYQLPLGDASQHQLNIMGGFTVEGDQTALLRASGSNFPNNQLKDYNLGSGTVFDAPRTHVESWNLVSYLARANYNFDSKYLLTASARYDGSSRFGAGNKYGFFPSGAFAWRVSDEAFMANQRIFDDLKIRTSYGVTGNQEIGNYQSLSLMGVVSVIAGDQGKTGVYPQNIGNPDLKWETTNQFDAGIDASLWNNRITVVADYYRKTTKDLLLNTPMPWTTGFADALVNIGKMRNEGFELSVGVNALQKNDWRLSFDLNFAKNKNTILELGDTKQFFVGQSEIIITEGIPLGSFYGLRADGIFQNEAEVANSAQKDAKPGDVRFINQNGDDIINADDRVIIGSAQPDFVGGGSLRVGYKGFEVSTWFNYVVGNSIYNKDRIDLDQPNGLKNHSTRILDRWTPTNPSTTIPRANRGITYQFSDRYIEDGSYFRLQDVTLSYKLPENFLNRSRLKNAMVYVSAENLLTLTDYTGYDPEVSLYGQSALSQGIDQGVYPTAKTFRLGIQLGF